MLLWSKYFDGDFENNDSPFQAQRPNDAPNLYNGNIAAWENGLSDSAASKMPLMERNMAYTYNYDLANRIKEGTWQNQSALGAAFTAGPNDEYNTYYSYDPNGNIDTLIRHGIYDSIFATSIIDKLSYTYDADANRLNSVADSMGAIMPEVDFPGTNADNYEYDGDGNLISDNEHNITNNVWDFTGKLTKVGLSQENLSFVYDAMGNRVAKHYTDDMGTPNENYYIRDASGNTLAVYGGATSSTNMGTIFSDGFYLEGLDSFDINISCGPGNPSSTTITRVIQRFPSEVFSYYGPPGQDGCWIIDSVPFTNCVGEGCMVYVKLCLVWDHATGDFTFAGHYYEVDVDDCATFNPEGPPMSYYLNTYSTSVGYGNYDVITNAPRLANFHIYGSEGHGRFSTWSPDGLTYGSSIDSLAILGMDSVSYAREKFQFRRDVGDKEYEVKDHLGNVRVTSNDMKQPIDENDLSLGYSLGLESISNYYPFGMQMPGMSWNEGDGYRYGFNGMERDNEIYGTSNSYDFGARMMDARLGRFFSKDRYKDFFPQNSPYIFAGNTPIIAVDLNGDYIYIYSEDPIIPIILDLIYMTPMGKTLLDSYNTPISNMYITIPDKEDYLGDEGGWTLDFSDDNTQSIAVTDAYFDKDNNVFINLEPKFDIFEGVSPTSGERQTLMSLDPVRFQLSTLNDDELVFDANLNGLPILVLAQIVAHELYHGFDPGDGDLDHINWSGKYNEENEEIEHKESTIGISKLFWLQLNSIPELEEFLLERSVLWLKPINRNLGQRWEPEFKGKRYLDSPLTPDPRRNE